MINYYIRHTKNKDISLTNQLTSLSIIPSIILPILPSHVIQLPLTIGKHNDLLLSFFFLAYQSNVSVFDFVVENSVR